MEASAPFCRAFGLEGKPVSSLKIEFTGPEDPVVVTVEFVSPYWEVDPEEVATHLVKYHLVETDRS